MNVETIRIEGIPVAVSRIALGAWAIGGWMWGGSDDTASVATIRGALDQGINLIDTAPVYGFGHSEEVVGEALVGRRQPAVPAGWIFATARPEGQSADAGGCRSARCAAPACELHSRSLSCCALARHWR